MSRRRPFVALLIAVVAVALPAGGSAWATGDASERSRDAAAIATALSGPDIVVARLTEAERIEKSRPQRPANKRVALLGILAAALVVVALGRCWSFLAAAEVRSHASWWSPQSGRAPPVLQLTIV